MQTKLMSREQAMKAGLDKGQLNHLLRTKKLKYVVGTDHLLDRDAVMPLAAEAIARRARQLTPERIRLASRALRVCSILMAHDHVKNCFCHTERADLVAAAEAFEYKLKEKKC